MQPRLSSGRPAAVIVLTLLPLLASTGCPRREFTGGLSPDTDGRPDPVFTGTRLPVTPGRSDPVSTDTRVPIDPTTGQPPGNTVGPGRRLPFTVALLPDTQYYSKDDEATYEAQTQWIVDNQDVENIQFVIHLGDITHDNKDKQWEKASAAHHILDAANIPYSVIPGNHDNPDDGAKRDTTRYNRFFGPQRFSGESWYGGHMGSTNDNNFTFFEVEDLNFMVVSLEFAPTKNALCWADSLIQGHPDRRVIIVTHCYQNNKDGYHNCNCATNYGITGSRGSTTWRELARRHNNVAMVLSGHVPGSAWRLREANGENEVHELLTDYQAELRGTKPHGQGWMRTLRFIPFLGKIVVHSFSVLDGVDTLKIPDIYSPTDKELVYTFPIDYNMKSPMPAYEYNRVTDAFHDLTVNSDSKGQQKNPEVAMAPNGDFVVVWADDSTGTTGVYEIYARGFYASGCEKFSDIVVNKIDKGEQNNPAIAMASDGSFVIVWEDDNNKNGKYQILAAGFSAFGTKQFGDVTVNTDKSGQQLNPTVAITSNKNFVVAWEDDSNNTNNSFEIYAAIFNASGVKQFGDITVNSNSSGDQRLPDVAGSSTGDFVVVWEDDSENHGSYQIFGAGFNSTGAKQFGDITVNALSAGQQRKPVVGMASIGSFVVAWEDDRNNSNGKQILAAGYSASGVRQFTDITVNEIATGEQRKPSIAVRASGSFVVTWEDNNDASKGYQIVAAGFDVSGGRQFGDITVNYDSNGKQYVPDVALDSNGIGVVTWQDDLNKNGKFQILARGLEEMIEPERVLVPVFEGDTRPL